jgi:hypothetical protein
MLLTDSDKIRLFNSLRDKWPEYIPQKYVRKVLGLFCQRDVAKRLGTSPTRVQYHYRKGTIPGPNVVVGKRTYWDSVQLRAVLKAWSQRRKYTPRGKHTAEEAAEMKRLHAAGWSQWSIAEKFGCSQSLVSRAVRGVMYRSSSRDERKE